MSGGGAERIAALLANQWVARGKRVTLVPTYAVREVSVYVLGDGVEVRHLSHNSATNRKSIWIQFKRLASLRSLMKSLRPDVVISFLTNVNVAAVLAAKGTGIPVVVSERIHPAQFPAGIIHARLRKLTYPWATCVVVQTETTRRWFNEYIPGAKIEVIANPIDWPLTVTTPIVSPQSLLDSDDKLLLAVGRLDPQKGFKDLIAAFAASEARRHNWKLVVLGEGDERVELESLINSLNLTDRVALPGWVGNVSDWYAAAQLFALSSHMEGFPNVLLEAMAHGLACVSYDCEAGPAEIIRDGLNGRLVPLVLGTAGLTAAIDELAADDEARTKLARNAVDVRREYALGDVLGVWERVLKAAIEPRTS